MRDGTESRGRAIVRRAGCTPLGQLGSVQSQVISLEVSLDIESLPAEEVVSSQGCHRSPDKVLKIFKGTNAYIIFPNSLPFAGYSTLPFSDILLYAEQKVSVLENSSLNLLPCLGIWYEKLPQSL